MRNVLLLNADCNPLNTISPQRALSLLGSGKAYIHPGARMESIRTTSRMLDLPLALVLRYYVKTPARRLAPTRRNILRRDAYLCQYCGMDLCKDEATIDHVTPRRRGGDNSWTNLVCACRECNLAKGNRTPREAGMPLRRKPKEPSIHALLGNLLHFYTEP